MNIRDLLEKQIVEDANNGDTTVLASLLERLPIATIYGALGDKEQAKVFCYEIHVSGKNSFSTSIVSIGELDEHERIREAHRQRKIDNDDCYYVDYTEELTFDEWNEHFNI